MIIELLEKGGSRSSSSLQSVVAMPSIPIIMPQLGESIAEATIVNLLVQIGDLVQADQDIIEVETNKATMNVTAPCPGRVEKFHIKLNESYPVGAVLGYLESSKEDAARLGLDAPAPEEDDEEITPRSDAASPGVDRDPAPATRPRPPAPS